jgi:hypothetical protein
MIFDTVQGGLGADGAFPLQLISSDGIGKVTGKPNGNQGGNRGGDTAGKDEHTIVLAPRVRPRGGIRGRSEASDFVVTALQETGLRFGTDGSVESLWDYLRTSHRVVSPLDAHPGDVLFFQTSQASAAPKIRSACEEPSHAGIVASRDGDGRIAFVEVRDGIFNRSYVDPLRPQLRRDPEGRIHNTFLRQKKRGDRPDSPNFAGEMLCGVARPRS